jgi:hypothetical protein
MTTESRYALEKRRLPMLACNRCGRPAYYDIEANKRCGQAVAKKACRGRIRFAAKADWTECPACNATGWNDGTCSRCDGIGWFFTASGR